MILNQGIRFTLVFDNEWFMPWSIYQQYTLFGDNQRKVSKSYLFIIQEQ